jgi:DNA (cytosine-5)-methyltransferase 1
VVLLERRVVELFAGVGGFRVAFNNVKFYENRAVERKKWKFVYANQWEPQGKQHAYDCYIKRFGDKEVVSNVDINKINKSTIPDHEILVGGFPCQDYSVAQNLRKSKGIEGKKGVLWWQIAEVIEAKKPPFVLFENVDRLLISPSNQRGRDFGIMLKVFHDNGYGVEWRVINSADYGHVQRRKRVYIFGFKNDTRYYNRIKKINVKDVIKDEGFFSRNFRIKNFYKFSDSSVNSFIMDSILAVSNNFSASFGNSGIMIDGNIVSCSVEPTYHKRKTLGTILEKNVDYRYLNQDQINKMAKLKDKKSIPRFKKGLKYFYQEGKMQFPDDLDKPARTILTSECSINRSSHVIKQDNHFRFLTPIEAERLNEFPDNWTNSGMPFKKRYFMMGNALVIGVIKKLSLELYSIIKKES